MYTRPQGGLFQEWTVKRNFSDLNYTFDKALYYRTKNSEKERSIPVIGSFVYFN